MPTQYLCTATQLYGFMAISPWSATYVCSLSLHLISSNLTSADIVLVCPDISVSMATCMAIPVTAVRIAATTMHTCEVKKLDEPSVEASLFKIVNQFLPAMLLNLTLLEEAPLGCNRNCEKLHFWSPSAQPALDRTTEQMQILWQADVSCCFGTSLSLHSLTCHSRLSLFSECLTDVAYSALRGRAAQR